MAKSVLMACSACKTTFSWTPKYIEVASGEQKIRLKGSTWWHMPGECRRGGAPILPHSEILFSDEMDDALTHEQWLEKFVVEAGAKGAGEATNG